jgi:hypothetical protein
MTTQVMLGHSKASMDDSKADLEEHIKSTKHQTKRKEKKMKEESVLNALSE